MTSQFNIDFLPGQTQKVFEELAERQFINKYSLVGGTALSLHLKHRLSVDLDFIHDEEKLTINEIKRYIAKRNTIRDYYDLYYLAKYHLSLLEIIKKTKTLMPNLSPITYTGTLVYTEDIDESGIAEHLQPAEIVTKNQISDFFTSELIKIKGKI